MRRAHLASAGVFVQFVTWRVGNAQVFGEDIGHALRWKINSTAALLRSAAAGVGGLSLKLATIWLIA